MKKSMQMVLMIMGLFIFFSQAQAKPPVTVTMTQGEAYVTALEGTAQAVCTAPKDTLYLRLKDTLASGCEVTTGARSRLELLLPDKSVVRFAENTKFRLVQVSAAQAGQRDIKVSVTIGKIWSNVRKALTGKSGFEVSCENAVAGVRGTVYRMDVEEDKSAMVKVYQGEVAVEGVKKNDQQGQTANNSSPKASGPSVVPGPKVISGPSVVPGPQKVSLEEWVFIVKSMQQIRINASGKAEEPKSFTEAEDCDAWVLWNKERDKRNE
jgi:hypothetical protein